MPRTTTLSGNVIDVRVELKIEECCNCGILFAMPDDWQRRRRNDHGTFYCPAGHAQHYTAKSDAQLLADERARSTRLLADLDQAQAATRDEERRHAATKGQLTKVRKRVANGVCPECHRSFANLRNHMDTKHGTGAAHPPAAQ